MKQIASKAVYLALFIFAITIPQLLQAQDPGPGPDVPLDGGLSLLLAAGAGYVAKKGYEKRKKAQLKDQIK